MFWNKSRLGTGLTAQLSEASKDFPAGANSKWIISKEGKQTSHLESTKDLEPHSMDQWIKDEQSIENVVKPQYLCIVPLEKNE